MRLYAVKSDKPMRWWIVRKDIQFVLNALSGTLPPPMTRDELVSALAAARAGDKAARDEIVLRNRRLVQYVVRRYMPLARAHGMSVDDMAQECMIGLIKAVDTYKPDKGAALSTYAVRCMCNGLLNYVNREIKAANTSPIDVPAAGKRRSVADTVAYEDKSLQAVDDAEDKAILSRTLRQVLAALPADEYEIITLYYGLDARTKGKVMTHSAVGKMVGRSTSYVSSHLHHARERLRHIVPRELLDLMDD